MQTGGASDYTQEQKINSKFESIELEGGANSNSRAQSSKPKWQSSGSISAVNKKRIQSGVHTANNNQITTRQVLDMNSQKSSKISNHRRCLNIVATKGGTKPEHFSPNPDRSSTIQYTKQALSSNEAPSMGLTLDEQLKSNDKYIQSRIGNFGIQT
jgi:hypothetical protein